MKKFGRVMMAGVALTALTAGAMVIGAHDVLAQVVATPVPVVDVGVVANATAEDAAGTAVNIGSVISTILEAIVSVIAVPLGWFLVKFAVKIAAGVGYKVADAQRERLEDIIINGIRWAAHELEIKLDPDMTKAQRDKIADLTAEEYVPRFGAETVAKLGGDVKDTVTMSMRVAGTIPKAISPLMSNLSSAFIQGETVSATTADPAASATKTG